MWLLRSKRISGLAWISKKRNGVQIAAWATQAPCDTCSWSRSQAASPSVAAQPTAIQRVVGVYKSYQTRVGNGPMPTEITSGDARQHLLAQKDQRSRIQRHDANGPGLQGPGRLQPVLYEIHDRPPAPCFRRSYLSRRRGRGANQVSNKAVQAGKRRFSQSSISRFSSSGFSD